VRIAASDPVTSGLVANIIDRVTRVHPRIVFHVKTGASLLAAQIDALRERKLDFVVGRLPRTTFDADLNVEILYQEPSVIAASARHRLAGRRRLKLAALMDEHWVLPDAESYVGTLVEELFRAEGLGLPRKAVFGTSIQLNNTLLATGRYLAFYPGSLLRLYGRELDIRELDLDLPARATPLGILTLKGRTPPPAARLVVECLREVARPWLKETPLKLERPSTAKSSPLRRGSPRR
jgi:DNA-binding transcriptional LysR family regulator